MKISENFILQKVADQYVVVPIEEKSISFKAMITLNETGAFLWDILKTDKTIDEAAILLAEEYELDISVATADTTEFIKKLQDFNILS